MGKVQPLQIHIFDMLENMIIFVARLTRLIRQIKTLPQIAMVRGFLPPGAFWEGA